MKRCQRKKLAMKKVNKSLKPLPKMTLHPKKQFQLFRLMVIHWKRRKLMNRLITLLEGIPYLLFLTICSILREILPEGNEGDDVAMIPNLKKLNFEIC